MRPRRIIWAFQDFMRRRKLAKLCPQTATLRKQREEARKAHRLHGTLSAAEGADERAVGGLIYGDEARTTANP
jgi:hypothetical protein